MHFLYQDRDDAVIVAANDSEYEDADITDDEFYSHDEVVRLFRAEYYFIVEV